MYNIIDIQTGLVVGSSKTRAAAQKRADKLDNVYGAFRYSVVMA